VSDVVARARGSLHAALHAVGIDLVRYRGTVFPHLRRGELLAERRIGVALDVGASSGGFAHDLRAGGFAGRIVSFEPLSDAYASLAAAAAADSAWEIRNLALGAVDGEAELNVAANSMSSSLLPMLDRHVAAAPQSAYVGTERVRVARLDSIREEILRPEERVFLKLDVQGFELAVLDGAAETLQQVEVLQTELSFFPLYAGDAPFAEVLNRLDDEGFNLLWFDGALRDGSGQLLQMDGVFARR
jgi:FkbM family methyltransferase